MDIPIRRRTLDAAYQDVLNMLLLTGEEVSPRGMLTRELRGATIELTEPASNLITLEGRRLNYGFAVAEWLWIRLGLNSLDLIEGFNSQLAKFSDDGIVLAGAYGPRIMPQLQYVVDTLERDPDSRQAVMTIWTPNPGPSKDIPCTVAMQFMIRAGRLEMLTFMRSNDAWLGLPYDVFTFTMLQREIAFRLGLRAGTYRHMVGSLHLYEQHFDAAAKLVEERPPFDRPATLDPMTVVDTDHLRDLYTELAHGADYDRLEAAIADLRWPWDRYLGLLQAYNRGTRGLALARRILV